MTIKLFYTPRTRAIRPRWLLEELGVPYELVRVDLGAARSEAHLAASPFGKVPALDDDGARMFESAAICAYLVERFPDAGLAPPAGSKARGAFLQWVVFASATLEVPLAAWYTESKRPEAERDAGRMAREVEAFHAAARVVSQALEGKTYLVEERFGVADLLVGSVLGWGRSMGLLAEHPSLVAYHDRLRARPAFARATAD